MMLILLCDFENRNYTKRAWFLFDWKYPKKRVFFTIPSIQKVCFFAIPSIKKACYLFDLSIQGVLSLRFQLSKKNVLSFRPQMYQKACSLFDSKNKRKRVFFSIPGILKSARSFRSQKFQQSMFCFRSQMSKKKRAFFSKPAILKSVLSFRSQKYKEVCFLFDPKCPKKRPFFSTQVF